MKREINISRAMNVPATLARARKAAERAAKKGLAGGYDIRIETRENGPVREDVLVIEGEPARYDGWTFVAMVEAENGSLVVSASPFYTGPAFDRDTFRRNACDHCGRDIYRKRYVIVERDGERKQVGGSCVKDFLGEEFRASYFSDPFGDIEEGYGGGHSGFHIPSALAIAARVVSARGFVKSSELGSTRDLVAILLSGKGSDYHRLVAEIGHPTTADNAEADAAFAWAAEMPGNSDYALNVQTVFSERWAADKRLGLVVSVIASYRRAQAEAAVKTDRPATPAPAGRVEVEGTVVNVKWVESQYGGSLKMLLEADAGYRVWATVPKDLTMILVERDNGWQEYREVTVGERVAFTATLEPSADDATFAFAKRPSKARLVAA